MEYLTVGTSDIKRDLFVPIKDGIELSIKPTGGIWLTIHDSKYDNYNPWVDYLVNNPDVLFFKSRGHDLWNQPCSIVTLNKDSNIYTLDNANDYEYLINNYPLGNDKFSYELMSHNYDGIYVDVLKMLHDIRYENQFKMIRQFCVSSLVLFNVDCIDYYNSGCVSITPFDLEYYVYECPMYKISSEKVKKKVR